MTRKAHAGDVMAGAGGAAGPAPDVRHQPAGDVLPQLRINLSNDTIQISKSHSGINAGRAVVEQPCSMHEVLGSNPAIFFVLPILIYSVIPHITRYIPFLPMYIPVYPNISRYNGTITWYIPFLSMSIPVYPNISRV